MFRIDYTHEAILDHLSCRNTRQVGASSQVAQAEEAKKRKLRRTSSSAFHRLLKHQTRSSNMPVTINRRVHRYNEALSKVQAFQWLTLSALDGLQIYRDSQGRHSLANRSKIPSVS